jgi:thiol:disulfide interchange protein
MRPAAPDGTRLAPVALLAAAVVCLAAWIGTSLWERSHPPVFADLVKWVPLAVAPDRAAGGKPILYYFTADWCGPCRLLRQEVFSSDERSRYLNEHFVPVIVVDRMREDGRNEPKVEELLRRYSVNAFPTLVVTGGPGTGASPQAGYPGKTKTWSFLMNAEQSFRVAQLKARWPAAGGASATPTLKPN